MLKWKMLCHTVVLSLCSDNRIFSVQKSLHPMCWFLYIGYGLGEDLVKGAYHELTVYFSQPLIFLEFALQLVKGAFKPVVQVIASEKSMCWLQFHFAYFDVSERFMDNFFYALRCT